MRKLKILHCVEFYEPSVGGAQEVVKQLSEQMVKLGHEVTVATSFITERSNHLINGVKVIDFEISGNFSSGLCGEVEKYTDFLLKSNFDIVMWYAAQQWTFDAALPILKKISAIKIFVPCGFSGLKNNFFSSYYDLLPKYLKDFDELVFLSDNYQDIEFCRKNNLNQLCIIPNGASEEEFNSDIDEAEKIEIKKKFRIPKNDFLVLHVGSHTGQKGHSEAISIFNQSSLTESTFIIVGNTYSKKCELKCRCSSIISKIKKSIGLSSKQIISTCATRKDTVALYKMADVFLFTSNIECSPIVLFESMASSTPFLTTNVGNSTEIINWSNGGLLIETTIKNGRSQANIQDGVNKLNFIYKNIEKRTELGNSGKMIWKERFTWEKISRIFENLYLKKMELRN